jgi:hypothetical protein
VECANQDRQRALFAHFLATRGPFNPDPDPESRRIAELVISTPALRAYARTLWTSCEAALAQAIAEQTGRDTSDLSLRLRARSTVPGCRATSPSPTTPKGDWVAFFGPVIPQVPTGAAARDL